LSRLKRFVQSITYFVTVLMMVVLSYWKRITIEKSKLKIFALLMLIGSIYLLTTYKGSGLTIGGDALIPFHPLNYLERLTYSTNFWEGFGSGLPPIFSLPTLPEILIFSAFDLMSFNIYIANKLYLFILATVSVFSMYYLGTTIFRGNRNRQLIGVATAISYVYNPLVMADGYKSMVFDQLSLAKSGLILFLALTIMFFRTGRIRYSIFSGFMTFFMLSTPGLGGYQFGFIAMIGYLCIALYFLYSSRQNLFRTVRGSLVTASLAFLVNSYWLVPFLESLNFYVSFTANFQTSTVFNNASVILNTLRLMNSWGFSEFTSYSGAYFNNPLIIILTFSWPFFAFAPLLAKKVRKSSKMLMLYAILLITILLACGSNPPLGSLYTKIVNAHIGTFYFLRPFYTTGAISQKVLTLEYAILIGLFSSLFYSKLKHFFKKPFFSKMGVIITLLILIMSTWPIVTGEIMKNWYIPSQYGVRIPDSYWQTNEYLKRISDLHYRTLLLPPTQVYIGTSWGYQGSSQFYNLMFDVPLITGNEIAYSITMNKTLLSQVYSIYYLVPEFDDAIDVSKQIDEILSWHNDHASLTEEHLQIDFNSSSQINSWHQVEIELLSTRDWLNNTHLLVQLSGELSLDRLQIGIGDIQRSIRWFPAQDYVYQLDNVTFIPTENEKQITQNEGILTLLMPLSNPSLPNYAINNITSLWIQYLVANYSDIATIQLNRMLVAKLSPNTLYYASLLARENIKYLLVDLAIKDGSKNEPQFWLQMLGDSNCFTLVWQKDTFYIFENNQRVPKV
jgi:hypothetical protein